MDGNRLLSDCIVFCLHGQLSLYFRIAADEVPSEPEQQHLIGLRGKVSANTARGGERGNPFRPPPPALLSHTLSPHTLLISKNNEVIRRVFAVVVLSPSLKSCGKMEEDLVDGF